MAIDFRLLNTPEAREAAERRRKELEASFAAKEASQKQMVEYLFESIYDELSEWEQSFVCSVRSKLNIYGVLSDKQDECLTKIFEKY